MSEYATHPTVSNPAVLAQNAAEKDIQRQIDQRACENAQTKTEEGSIVRREIDRIARQLDGLTKSLKRVKDSL